MFFYASKILWFLVTPSNLLVLLTGAGLVVSRLAAGPGRGRFGFWLSGIGLVALAAAGLGPAGSLVLRPLENRFPVFLDQGGRVDGIIVLGGAIEVDTSVDRHQLTTGRAGDRLIAMADLARRYPAARIVYSGGSGTVLTTEEAAEADLVAANAAMFGIRPGRIEAEAHSRTTWENATNTRALVGPRPGERWLLITSAWHMPRAIGCFRQVGLPVVAYPVDFLTSGDHVLTVGEGRIGRGLERLDIGTREWLGLLGYWLSGRTEEPFPAPRSGP